MQVRSPLHSDEVSGKFDGGIIFEMIRKRSYAKKMKSPDNPRTNDQGLSRGAFTRSTRDWGGLTEGQRAAWEGYGDPALPGYNKYISLAIVAINQGAIPVKDPPAVDPPGPVLGLLAAPGGPGEIILTWDPASPGEKLELYLTGDLPPGRKPKLNDYRLLSFVDITIGNETLEGLKPSSKYGIKARASRENGQVGPFSYIVQYSGALEIPCCWSFRVIPGRLMKVDLLSRQILASYPGRAGDNQFMGLCFDNGKNNLIVGCYDTSRKIVRFNAENLNRIDELICEVGEQSITTLLNDPLSEYCYAGCRTYPGKIIKINSESFTREAVLNFSAGQGKIYCGAIDPEGGYAYFGGQFAPWRIYKIRLSDFTLQGTLAGSAGSEWAESMTIDHEGGFLYAGIGNAPGRVVKIKLSDFTVDSELTWSAGLTNLYSIGIDKKNDWGFALFALPTPVIGKFRLSDMSVVGSIVDPGGVGYVRSLVVSPEVGQGFYPKYYVGLPVIRSFQLSDLTMCEDIEMLADYVNAWLGVM